MSQTFDPEKRDAVCPHARRVSGVTPERAGIVCGAMEADQNRADAILEGAPVGVFISVGDDPSTWANLCTGQGEPILDPDDIPERAFGLGHYTGCPIFQAAREIQAAERMFAPESPGSTSAAGIGPMELTEDDLREVGLK